MICIITALMFFDGCESKAPPPPEQKMVRKKISAGKTPQKTPVAEKKKPTAAGSLKPAPQKEAPRPAPQKASPQPAPQVAKKAVPAPPPQPA